MTGDEYLSSRQEPSCRNSTEKADVVWLTCELHRVGLLSIAPAGILQPALCSVIRNLQVEEKSFDETPQLRFTVATCVRVSKGNAYFQTLGTEMRESRVVLCILSIGRKALDPNTAAFADRDE